MAGGITVYAKIVLGDGAGAPANKGKVFYFQNGGDLKIYEHHPDGITSNNAFVPDPEMRKEVEYFLFRRWLKEGKVVVINRSRSKFI
jgi:hypothetical protein